AGVRGEGVVVGGGGGLGRVGGPGTGGKPRRARRRRPPAGRASSARSAWVRPSCLPWGFGPPIPAAADLVQPTFPAPRPYSFAAAAPYTDFVQLTAALVMADHRSLNRQAEQAAIRLAMRHPRQALILLGVLGL